MIKPTNINGTTNKVKCYLKINFTYQYNFKQL